MATISITTDAGVTGTVEVTDADAKFLLDAAAIGAEGFEDDDQVPTWPNLDYDAAMAALIELAGLPFGRAREGGEG